MQRPTVEWADPANTDKGVIIKIPGSAPVTITEGAEIDVGGVVFVSAGYNTTRKSDSNWAVN